MPIEPITISSSKVYQALIAGKKAHVQSTAKNQRFRYEVGIRSVPSGERIEEVPTFGRIQVECRQTERLYGRAWFKSLTGEVKPQLRTVTLSIGSDGQTVNSLFGYVSEVTKDIKGRRNFVYNFSTIPGFNLSNTFLPEWDEGSNDRSDRTRFKMGQMRATRMVSDFSGSNLLNDHAINEKRSFLIKDNDFLEAYTVGLETLKKFIAQVF